MSDTWTLTLRALPSDERPVEVRIRLGLKHLLRACSLRCIDVRPEIARTTLDTRTADSASQPRGRRKSPNHASAEHPGT